MMLQISKVCFIIFITLPNDKTDNCQSPKKPKLVIARENTLYQFGQVWLLRFAKQRYCDNKGWRTYNC